MIPSLLDLTLSAAAAASSVAVAPVQTMPAACHWTGRFVVTSAHHNHIVIVHINVLFLVDIGVCDWAVWWQESCGYGVFTAEAFDLCAGCEFR